VDEIKKGIALTMQTVLVGLFIIGITALITFLVISRFLKLHVAVEEGDVERRTMNIANVLLSYEGLAYVDEEGMLHRGIFDKEKLDNVTTFIQTTDSAAYAVTILKEVRLALSEGEKEWSIGYPNSVVFFLVIDGNKAWVGSFRGPLDKKAFSYLGKFLECLEKNVDIHAAIFGHFPWYLEDLWKCWENTLGELVKKETEKTGRFLGFSKNPSTDEGFPVLIRYPNGNVHVGRLLVGVWECL